MKKWVFAFLVFFIGCTQPVQITTITVSSNADAGAGSLRQALIDVADGGTIDLIGINTQIVTLSSTLVFNKNLTIINTAPTPSVTLQGGATAFQIGNVRIIEVQAGKTVILNTLTLRNGSSTGALATGGAILNAGTLTLNNVTLSDNQALGSNGGTGLAGGAAQGGAIHNSGTLTINSANFNGNKAIGGRGGNGENQGASPATPGGSGGLAQGGAIFIAPGGTLTINTAIFNANTATGGDGGNAGVGPVPVLPGLGATANGGGGFKASGATVTVSGITNGSGGNANLATAGVHGVVIMPISIPSVTPGNPQDNNF